MASCKPPELPATAPQPRDQTDGKHGHACCAPLVPAVRWRGCQVARMLGAGRPRYASAVLADASGRTGCRHCHRAAHSWVVTPGEELSRSSPTDRLPCRPATLLGTPRPQAAPRNMHPARRALLAVAGAALIGAAAAQFGGMGGGGGPPKAKPQLADIPYIECQARRMCGTACIGVLHRQHLPRAKRSLVACHAIRNPPSAPSHDS